MLENAYKQMEVVQKHKLKLPELNIETQPTKARWINVTDYLKIIKHDFTTVLEFMKKEMKGRNVMAFSQNEEEGILIQGKKIKKQDIISIVEKYIMSLVNCEQCKNAISTLTKTEGKFYQYECLCCGFSKCVTI